MTPDSARWSSRNDWLIDWVTDACGHNLTYLEAGRPKAHIPQPLQRWLVPKVATLVLPK